MELVEELEIIKRTAELAKAGNAKAQNNLGLIFQKGEIISKDSERAFKWFKKSAEQGNSKAQNHLGWLYEHGEGTSKDYQEALKWYTKSAEQGNSNAKYNIDLLFQNVDEESL